MASSSFRESSFSKADPSDNLDMSQVRPQAKLAISGIEQVMDVLLYGTLEVKQYLAAECDLIFECRVCRALFRSLPNFVGHKRAYCTEKMKIQMVVDEEGTADDSVKNNDEDKGAEREFERSASLPNGKVKETVEEKSGSAKQETSSPVSISAAVHVDPQLDKPNSSSAPKGSKSKANVAVRQPKSSPPNETNGKLTYADVVDFVKKTCKLCGMKAAERRHLVEHARNIHADRLYFLQCPHCPCSFFITGNLTRHLKNAHQVDAKAADVTLVLPGMNTHAMSLLTAKKSSALPHQNGGRIRTTFTQNSRKRPAASSEPATADNSPTTAGNARKVPQRKAATDSVEAGSQNSLDVKNSKAKPSNAKSKKDTSIDESASEEDEELSLAAMVHSSKANSSSLVGDDDVSDGGSGGNTVPNAVTKSGNAKALANSRTRSRSQVATVSASKTGIKSANVDSSPHMAQPAAKVARLDSGQSSGANSSQSHSIGSDEPTSTRNRDSLATAASGNTSTRNSRKATAALATNNQATLPRSSKSVVTNNNSDSVRVSTRRLSLSPNSSSAPDMVLNFVCRRCSFSSLILSECVSHVTSDHAVKVDRRDFQPHIEVRRQAMSQQAATTGTSAKIAATGI